MDLLNAAVEFQLYKYHDYGCFSINIFHCNPTFFILQSISTKCCGLRLKIDLLVLLVRSKGQKEKKTTKKKSEKKCLNVHSFLILYSSLYLVLALHL